MKRTLYYDLTTGQLLHSHYEVQVIESHDRDARLSAPAAVEPDAQLAELISRGLDPSHIGSLTTSAPPQSSRRMARSVHVKSRRLRSRRIELADDDNSEET